MNFIEPVARRGTCRAETRLNSVMFAFASLVRHTDEAALIGAHATAPAHSVAPTAVAE